jgi:hypothetical protein
MAQLGGDFSLKKSILELPSTFYRLPNKIPIQVQNQIVSVVSLKFIYSEKATKFC